MSFGIVVDSSCDLTREEAQERNIVIAPLTITLDGKEYRDGIDIKADEFVELIQQTDGMPKTAQVSPAEFAEHYQQLADVGCEEIISIHISSPLSGTCGSAALAAKDAPVPVHVIDSCGVTIFTGLIALFAADMRDRGESAETTVELVKKAIKQSYFAVAPDILDYLLKGGRLSPLEAKAAGLLNIKPVISFDEAGALKSVDKKRGMKNVVKAFVERIEKQTAEYGKLRIMFCHTANMARIEEARAALKERGIDYVDEGARTCGATVATHLGPGGVGFTCLPVEVR